MYFIPYFPFILDLKRTMAFIGGSIPSKSANPKIWSEKSMHEKKQAKITSVIETDINLIVIIRKEPYASEKMQMIASTLGWNLIQTTVGNELLINLNVGIPLNEEFKEKFFAQIYAKGVQNGKIRD